MMHRITVWGDYACFTRPEMKGERFSYPIMTPSAARGILDAIFAKPQSFRWQVTRISLLTKPSYIALRRNEVKEKIPARSVSRWMTGHDDLVPIWADGDSQFTGSDEKGRTQRQTMALRNVRYDIEASIEPWPQFKRDLDKLNQQFRRRASQGKCFHQPYFGCREFPAFFSLNDPNTPPEPPVQWDADLGLILYDVFDLSRPGAALDTPAVSLFEARVRNGIIQVPSYEDDAVLKNGKRAP